MDDISTLQKISAVLRHLLAEFSCAVKGNKCITIFFYLENLALDMEYNGQACIRCEATVQKHFLMLNAET